MRYIVLVCLVGVAANVIAESVTVAGLNAPNGALVVDAARPRSGSPPTRT